MSHWTPTNYSHLTTPTAELFRLVDPRIRRLRGVEVVSKAERYIDYGIPEIMARRHGFVRLVSRKRGRLVVRLRMPLTQIVDSKELCRTGKREGWPTEFNFDSLNCIDDIMALIEQAYQYNRA